MDHATDLIAEGVGLAILGPAGVGKSRVLHEVASRVAESSTVLSIVASASTRSIPFAPFVELLPAGPTQDELMMLTAARATLEQMGQSGGVVLAIDDAHQLDRVSLAFLLSVVSSRTATVVMTARTGEAMPSDLVDLWTNGVIERIDLEPLGRGDVSSLLERRLGPITPELEDELWQLTQGNALVLHEMVEGAVGASSLSRGEDELWRLAGSIVDSPRLSDLVLSRLSALPASLRTSMEIVAVGAPIPLEVARLAIGEPLSELEQGDLVQIAGRGDGRQVVPGHPLYGEILAASLGDLRRQAAYETLTNAAVNSSTALADPLRPALWQRDGGILLSREIAVAGSREALSRHDPELALELLEPLESDDHEVAILKGRSLSYLQRFAEAEAILEGLNPSDPRLATEAASIRGQNLAFGLGRIADAREIFESVAEAIDDPDSRARLANERAMVSAVWGDFDDAMSASHAVLDDSSVSDVPHAAAYVTLTVALAMTARSEEFAALVEDARDVTTLVAAAMPFARDQVEVMWAMSLMNSGRFDEAVSETVRARSERANQLTSGTLLGTHALASIEMGRLPEGLEKACEALEVQRRYDPFGLVPQSLGLIALAHGQMGDPAGLADVEEIQLPVPAPRLTIWIDRGRAWATAATADLDGAARIAADGGRNGIAGEHFSWALLCLHDAVRFGRPDLVIDEIRSIDTSHGADYLVELQNHAEALLERDPTRLAAVGERFGEFGSSLLMAEAFARASRILDEAGDEAQAAKACAIAKTAGALCKEARTPALASCSELVTDREVQVAVDAARGLTSPEIAIRRFISVRTVDNHLRSVYRKMDISGRDELADVLAPAVRLSSRP